MDEEKKRPLHNSQMQQLWRCAYKFYRKFIVRDHEPISYSLALGIATHDAIARSLRMLTREADQHQIGRWSAHRLNSPTDLSTVQEIASAAALAVCEREEVYIDDEDTMTGDGASDLLRSESIGLASCYAEQIAPGLTIPVLEYPGQEPSLGIEWRWVIHCPGWPYDIAGQMDVIALSRTGRGLILRDTKTSAKMPAKDAARSSHQLSMYALALSVLFEQMPRAVFLDYLVRAGKTVPARVRTLESRRNEQTNEAMKLRVQTAMHAIEQGAFPPCDPGEWWCNSKYCGFHRDGSCPYVRGLAQIPVFELPEKKELKPNGTAKKSGKNKRGTDSASLFDGTL